MDVREQRGKEIAAMGAVKKTAKDLVFQVAAQSRNKHYQVNLEGDDPVCDCPDFELRNKACKHIFAVAFTVVGQQNSDGSTTVTETVTVTARKQKTYPQNWPAYNKAQTTEQDKFQALLHDLCAGIQEPESKFGRPPLPLKDMIFSTTFKTYSTFSGRRFMSDLREAHERGHIGKTPHYNSIFRYLESESLTPILRDLVTQSSLPLKSVETDFAVDSSGFTTSKFIRWLRPRRRISQFPKSADKAYGSIKCVESVVAAKGTPYIALRTTATGAVGGAYQQMFHYFQFKRDEFLAHYHKRSNAESVFSMVKRKFGDYLRSKTDVAMLNEALCKILCHNIVVLIHEMHELGIEPIFWVM